MPDDYWEEWLAERAAILQFDAGMPRGDAEKAAQALVDSARSTSAVAGGKDDIPVDAAIQSAAHQPPPNNVIPFDPAARRDLGAYPGSAENRAHRPAKTYAVAAARASPAYLESLKVLRQTLPNFKPNRKE